MKKNIIEARIKIDNQYKLNEHKEYRVRYASRLKLDALRDSVNEIEKKLDRLAELDSALKLVVQIDIKDLWNQTEARIKLLKNENELGSITSK